MKTILIIFLVSTILSLLKAEPKRPESIVFDAVRNCWYISSTGEYSSGKPDNDGKIVKLNPDGKFYDFISGLSDPKGIILVNDNLFVADINQVVKVDVKNAKIIKKNPIKGSIFLNDIEIDAKKNINF